jgi:hypothetical protein
MTLRITPPTTAEPIHDRAWWAAESARVGTDWQSIGELAARVLLDLALTPCPTCEHTPCPTPSFCEQCHEADQQQRTTDMPDFDNTNRGVLFNERDKKQTDKDRDYGGQGNLNGVEFWISAWINTSKKGAKYLSLRLKPKEVESSGTQVDIADEIPF